MYKKFPHLLFICMILALLITGCSTFSATPIPAAPDTNTIHTQVAGTLFAQMTLEAPAATDTPMPTQTALPTNTPEPTSTHTQVPESTSTANTPNTAPSSTPKAAATSIPQSASVSCNLAQLVQDVTVQDYTAFSPGTAFTKIWRLKNVGSCTWTQGYSLIFNSGDVMDAKRSIALPKSVAPGQTVDISAKMKAPSKKGTYKGYWMLGSSTGSKFGLGAKGDQPFWVAIRVMNVGDASLAYDFAANYCLASWKSGDGQLSCPGTSKSSDGFVILLDSPSLENRHEDEWTLWAHPDNSIDGWISGTYPEFTIKEDQHFIAWVGCLDDSKGCNVTFSLDFKNVNSGNIKNLGSWTETFDGNITKIDLDLSTHAGKTVRFILTVEVNGGKPEMANAFWFVPGIINKDTD